MYLCGNAIHVSRREGKAVKQALGTPLVDTAAMWLKSAPAHHLIRVDSRLTKNLCRVCPGTRSAEPQPRHFIPRRFPPWTSPIGSIGLVTGKENRQRNPAQTPPHHGYGYCTKLQYAVNN